MASKEDMASPKQHHLQTWVQTWQQAGSALQQIKLRELRSYDYAKNLPILDDLLQWAYEHRTVRLTSGLVEQQRLFMKLRGRQDE